jgi:hypothetical protein
MRTLGSSSADRKTHAAFHQAMKNIFRTRQPGNGPRLNREHDKPATLNTSRSAGDTPESTDDVRFDYELRNPFSVYGAAAIAVIILLLMITVGVIMHFL